MSNPQYQRGDIVQALVPHTDGSGESRHPCLVIGDPLANSHGDYILLQITTTTWSSATDHALRDTDPEFSQSGLAHTSTIRCHKIFAITETRVRKQFGIAGPNTIREVEKKVRLALGL